VRRYSAAFFRRCFSFGVRRYSVVLIFEMKQKLHSIPNFEEHYYA